MTNEQLAIMLEFYKDLIDENCAQLEKFLKEDILKDDYLKAELVLSPLKCLLRKLIKDIKYLKEFRQKKKDD